MWNVDIECADDGRQGITDSDILININDNDEYHFYYSISRDDTAHLEDTNVSKREIGTELWAELQQGIDLDVFLL